MVKGGKVSSKRKFETRVRSKYKDSDDSDEDYVISDEENEVSEELEEEDYCSSVDGDASEESFGSFDEEEEDEEEEVKRRRKKSRSRAKKGSDNFIVDEDIEEEEEGEDEEEMKPVRKAVRSRVQNGFSGRQKNGLKPSRKKTKVTYQEVEDQDFDDEDDDDDEEFTLDEDDFSEMEEKPVVKKKKTNVKVGKRRLKKKPSVRGEKRRQSIASKKPLRKNGRTRQPSRRKVTCVDDLESDDDFMESILPVRENYEKKSGRKRRRYVAPSDSDFVSYGSSDHDYTISEEEREQVIEARELCERLKTNLRSSSVSTHIQEDMLVEQPRKPPRRKGKEKIEQVKVEMVKQVCGICLSEEDKRRVRGTLDCCTHYFCFACIMEWGKVESRCPLCKQRFKTISKPGRSTTGIDLREVVIQVPERDQVYQPTEEELRSYLDPYENVICTECHEGGEDGLMLLCDLCDSPAHTYCVGLGREVPEGNWYCDSCRPVAMGSSSSQAQGRMSDQRTTNNILSNRQSPVVNFDEGAEIDLNLMSSPRFTQGFGNLPSPRFPVGSFQAASPVSGGGAGAPTLSERRVIHRHIQQLLYANRTSFMASRTERNSSDNISNDFLNSQASQGRETTVQHARTDEMEASYHTFFEERLQDNRLAQLQDNDIFSSTLSHQRQAIQDPTTTSAERSLNGALWPERAEMNSISGYGQFHHISSRPNMGPDGGVSPNTAIEQSDFQRAKEQLKVMVRRHLDNLSRDIDLDKVTFKDIARRSTHTILAACGHEHRRNEVVAMPPPSTCCHFELMAGGKTSLLRGCCSSCFESFVGEVVKRILDTKPPQWLSLGL